MQADRFKEYSGNAPRDTEELGEWHASVPPVEAFEPNLPIVDAHHHAFGAHGQANYYTIDDLHRDIVTGHQIIGTVYVEAYSSGWRTSGPSALRPVGEVEMIVGLTGVPLKTGLGQCQVAAGIVSHADLTLGERVVDVLAEQQIAGQGRLRGVRHRTASTDGTVGRFMEKMPKPNLMSDIQFRRGFAKLDQFGLSFDAWVYHTQLGEVVELADAFPNTTIVLNHVGGPLGVAEFREGRAETRRRWGDMILALAARQNIRVKIGGMGMPVYGFGFEQSVRPASADELSQAWFPYIDKCLEAFGSKRCMFESNFPVDKQSCSYVEIWNAFKLTTGALTHEERKDLFYRSACQTYRLPNLERCGDKATSSLNR